jgi:DNA (cytosine-5)-methyltransferase 1
VNVLDLFSGIGGFSLGLERAGLRTVAFCEIDPYCRAVLAKHWPGVPCYDDITTLTVQRLAADGIIDDVADAGSVGRSVAKPENSGGHCATRGKGREQASRPARSGIDLICGGFPCQDISTAGKGAGITGARSGLWSEYARIIGEIRPRYVIVENVAALLGRGIERVLGDLAALGFDAEWHCIPASAVGAPHRRDRVWIVAYPKYQRWRGMDTAAWNGTEPHGGGEDVVDADSRQMGRLTIAWGQCDQWLVEPDVGRVAHGVSARVDRLRSLGNAVVPQIPEIIGRAIMSSHIAKLVITEY